MKTKILFCVAFLATILFTACKQEVESIELDKTTLTMQIGEQQFLTATISPKNADQSVSWASSNINIVSVDENGKISALAAGDVTITAKAGSKTAICEVSVVLEVQSITLSRTSLSLEVGQTHTLTATVLPSNAPNNTVTWTSSNTSVASVTNGVVTAKAVGNATITAKAGSKTATCAVSVKNNPSTYDVGVVISGIKWATRNVNTFGNFATAPESAGMLYQWNKPKAWSATGNVTGWDSDPNLGETWTAANDPCPNGWRVPTDAELTSLRNAGSHWTTQNGTNGRKFGTAPYQIFLPAVGYRNYSNGTLAYIGTYGRYWTSTEDSNIYYANCLFFSSANGDANMSRYANKADAYSIRCVAE